MDEVLAATGEPLPPDWALQDPRGLPRRAAARRARGGGRRGHRPGPGRRHRHRLHRVHGAARARRRDAAVPAAGAGRPAARLRQAVEAPRRPAAGGPDQRAGRTSGASPGWPATAARSPPSGSSPRRCSCWRRTRRSTRGPSRWIEAADWIIWQLTGVETRNACTAGYKGIWQDGQYPSREFLAALDPRVRGLRRRTSWRTRSSSSAARAGSLTAEAAGWTGLPEGIAVAVGNVDAHVTPPAAAAIAPGPDGRHHGHLHLPRDERRPAGRGARHVRRGGRRHRGRAVGLRGRAERGRATSSPGSPSTRCRPSYLDEAERRGISLHDLLSEEAAAQPAGRARPDRAGLAERQPRGAGRPPPVRRRSSG